MLTDFGVLPWWSCSRPRDGSRAASCTTTARAAALAQVQLSGRGAMLATATDSEGRYAFESVRLGGFSISATEPGTGDRGALPACLQRTARRPPRTSDSTGTGLVRVAVRDARAGP